MHLSGHTKPYAVLGHPIGHTLSPVMHNAAMKTLGMDAIYLAFDVPPQTLMTVLPVMADMGFQGVNLTIPLKEVAFEGLSDLDESARTMGSVNTIEFSQSGMKGHSTDGHGFLAALREAFGASVSDMSVFVLGCGGAGRAVALTCALEGAARIILTDLDPKRPERVTEEIAMHAPTTTPEILPPDKDAWHKVCRETDLVVQATPVGMKKFDKALLEASSFRSEQIILDLIYMYPQTVFMKEAQEAGARTVNGLGMLLHQGVRSFEIWTGQKPPVEMMRAALERHVYGKHNN